jgi:hypothetical protein
MWVQKSGVKPRFSLGRCCRGTRVFKDGSEEERIDVHQRRLQKVQTQHGCFGVFAVGAGEVAVFAVEHDPVSGVPLLNDLEPTVDFAS